MWWWWWGVELSLNSSRYPTLKKNPTTSKLPLNPDILTRMKERPKLVF